MEGVCWAFDHWQYWNTSGAYNKKALEVSLSTYYIVYYLSPQYYNRIVPKNENDFDICQGLRFCWTPYNALPISITYKFKVTHSWKYSSVNKKPFRDVPRISKVINGKEVRMLQNETILHNSYVHAYTNLSTHLLRC